MTTVCDTCGFSNRPNAMFCSGCARTLPGFAPTGPSALETMKSLHYRPTAAPAVQALPAESPLFWLRLGAGIAAMGLGFAGWWLYVTRVDDRPMAPVLSAAVVQPVAPPASAPIPAAMAMAPAQPAAAPAAATATAATESGRPVAASGAVQVVEGFYRALSTGDGRRAAEHVVLAKRGAGPFEAAELSRFYRSFREPLAIRSVRSLDADVVEARYRYRAGRTVCEGVALVRTAVVQQRTLIRSIRANC